MVKLSRRHWCLALALASALLPTFASADDTAALAFADGGSRLIMDAGGLNMGSGGSALYLDVVLNGHPTERLAQFILLDDQLMASHGVLAQLGIKVPSGLPEPLALASLPGAEVVYDQTNQRLELTLPLALLNAPTTRLNQTQPGVPQATASPGLLLNYDVHANHSSGGFGSLSGLTELRVLGTAGLLDTSFLSQAVDRGQLGWHTQSVRLDSFYRRSFPQQMLTLTIGDTITGALDWSRPTRITGVQLRRNFGLQPYRITTLIPQFMGQVTTPSDVELYIDGVRQYSGRVEPGPFELQGSPVISGAGMAQVVLTDAFGRATTLDFPFYTTDQLLQEGLADWSASLGVVRRNYGLSSFDYAADPAVSGSWRYGLSDSLTVQAHGEAIVGLAAAGAGAALRLGRAGVLHGSAAYSSNRAGSGALGNIGYNWRRGRFNFALDSTRTKDEWRDVAARYGSLPPRVSERALVGISSELAGSFSLSYLRLRYPGHDDSRYANAFWSRAFGPLSLSLSLNQNLDRHSDRSVFFGISMSLDRGLHVGSSVQRSHDRTRFSVNASQPIPGDGGFGWRAQAQTGRHNSGGMAEAGYLGRYGELRGGVRRHNHNSLVYGNLSGSLVRMGDHTFAARRVDNAFAVVSTDGIAGVPVKLENRVIGHTNAAGMLLVSRLNAWQQNKLAIDPMDLPANVRIDRVSTFATPRDSAGTLVEFGIREIRAASIVLVDETGAPLPVGSRVQTAGPGARSSAVVGYDGIVYLDALQDHNLLTVHTDAGPCRVAFDFAGSGEIVPQIGPFTCQPEAET